MWTRGYFCGTVGEVDKETIERYIENQGKEETRDDFTIVEEQQLELGFSGLPVREKGALA